MPTDVEQAIVERHLMLGIDLVALRNAAGSNREFAGMARRTFDIDPVTASLYVRVAKAYGDRGNITRRVSWPTLVALSMLPGTIRQELERRILDGEHISAADISKACRSRRTIVQKESALF
jgi:hypothetical protein